MANPVVKTFIHPNPRTSIDIFWYYMHSICCHNPRRGDLNVGNFRSKSMGYVIHHCCKNEQYFDFDETDL